MSRVDDSFVQLLERQIGGRAVVCDPEIVAPYGRDESGEPAQAPGVVVRPQKPDQVRAVLQLTAERKIPVTPRGGGTGKSGGAIPTAGGLVLSFEKMNRILDVDARDLVAVCEPGVVLECLHDAVEGQGLFYPPDPASLDACSLGGNIAENAGGPRAVRYGVTGDYVLGLELALMGGDRLETGGRTVKNVAGYDLTSLVVGSEGTLAVVTRIQLRLVARPRAVAALWVDFSHMESAGEAISVLLRSGLNVRCLEVIDEVAWRHAGFDAASNADAGAATEAQTTPKAALLIELDGHEDALEARLLACGEICEAAGALDSRVAADAASRRRLWASRRRISTALSEAAPHKISEDIAVPVGCIGEMCRAIKRIGRDHEVQTAVYGHAGDGNLHVNLLAQTAAQKARLLDRAVTELMLEALAFGGTLTAEHGIGTAKKRWMAAQFPPQELALMQQIKRLWDPGGLLNPKKIFPPR
jgi:glycolate oxidase